VNAAAKRPRHDRREPHTFASTFAVGFVTSAQPRGMVSTSEADWTEYECPPTDVAVPTARAVSHRTPANTTTPRSVAVTSTAARLNELGHLLVDLESQLIGAAQQRTWEQCRHHWKQRVFSLAPGDDTCRRLSLLLLGTFERRPSKPTKR